MLTSFNPRGSVLAVGAVTERVRASQSIQRPRQLDLPRCLRRDGRRGRPIRRRRSRRWPATPATTCGRRAAPRSRCWAIPAVPSSSSRRQRRPHQRRLMVERAAPQSQLDALLGGDWADRASYIAAQGNAIWSTFGADPAVYANTQQAILAALDNPAVNPMSLAAAAGYSGSADNRTIWLHAPARAVQHAVQFGAAGRRAGYAWTGPLSLPSTIAARHHRGPLGRPGDLWFNNPVHAANGRPAPRSGSSGRRPGVARQLALYDDSLDRRHATARRHRHRHAGRGRRLLQFPAGDRRLGAARSRCSKPACSQHNLLGALNAYRQDLGLRPLSADELQSIGGNTVRRAATSSSWRSTCR